MCRVQFRAALVVFVFIASAAVGGTVRGPVVAGAFYPGDSAELARTIRTHLSNVMDQPAFEGEIVALIVPHAGLVYSGQIAAHSYKTLQGTAIDRVILCGPAHRHGFDGVSVYGPGVTWKTPLGEVACNDELCNLLLNSSDKIKTVEQAHAQEHSLEVQLPYLQTVLTDFEIAPVTMGYPTAETIDVLADALAAAAGPKTVMVASTDWQHYRPASQGWKMDSLGIACLESLDPERLENYLAEGKVEACGGGPSVAVLKAAIAQGADKVKMLKYGDSGDVSGDKSSVVSYIAAVIYKSPEGGEGETEPREETSEFEKEYPPAFELTDTEKERLLVIARQSIEHYLKTGSLPQFDSVPENLHQPGAAFVTLEKNSQLRGCIGHTVAQEPLYSTVSTCAVQAAVADRRFPPVGLQELAELHIEVSVLTPLQDVKMLNEIEVGRDGLMISMGSRRGLLLPQVASEYGWDRTQFLRQTCLKAGLPTDAYKSPHARIQKFRAVIFEEK